MIGRNILYEVPVLPTCLQPLGILGLQRDILVHNDLKSRPQVNPHQSTRSCVPSPTRW